MAMIRAVPVNVGFTAGTNSVAAGFIPLERGSILRSAYLTLIVPDGTTAPGPVDGWLQLVREMNTQLTRATSIIMDLDAGVLRNQFQSTQGSTIQGFPALQWEGNFLNSGEQIVYVQGLIVNFSTTLTVSAVMTAWKQPQAGG